MQMLGLPSAFSSNGDGFASHNKVIKEGEDIEAEFPLHNFPEPLELWKRYREYHKIEDSHEDLIFESYYLDGSGKEPPYYQMEAINRTMEAIAKGQNRILLVLAKLIQHFKLFGNYGNRENLISFIPIFVGKYLHCSGVYFSLFQTRGFSGYCHRPEVHWELCLEFSCRIRHRSTCSKKK